MVITTANKKDPNAIDPIAFNALHILLSSGWFGEPPEKYQNAATDATRNFDNPDKNIKTLNKNKKKPN